VTQKLTQFWHNRLTFESSLADRLRTYLTTGNFDNGGFTNPESLNTYMARLSYQADLNNDIILDLLEYRLPAFDDRVVSPSFPGFSLSNVLTANSPYFDTGRFPVWKPAPSSNWKCIGCWRGRWLLSERVRLQVAYGTGGNPIRYNWI